jgi:hypothetical protein
MNADPITVLMLAEFILGREARTGQDFADAGLPMLGGCELCGATIAAYNASPSRSGYLRCAEGCIGDLGFDTVEAAAYFLFPELFCEHCSKSVAVCSCPLNDRELEQRGIFAWVFSNRARQIQEITENNFTNDVNTWTAIFLNNWNTFGERVR